MLIKEISCINIQNSFFMVATWWQVIFLDYSSESDSNTSYFVILLPTFYHYTNSLLPRSYNTFAFVSSLFTLSYSSHGLLSLDFMWTKFCLIICSCMKIIADIMTRYAAMRQRSLWGGRVNERGRALVRWRAARAMLMRKMQAEGTLKGIWLMATEYIAIFIILLKQIHT